MKALKIILSVVVVLGLSVAGAGYYLLYSPEVIKPELSGRYQNHQLEIDGLERNYQLYVPANLNAKAPVVFILHGSTRSGDQMRQSSAYEFDQLADKHGYLLVYPDGFDNHWNDCRGSATYLANQNNIDDVKFLDTIVENLKQKYTVNTERVFAAGFSNGGHMAYRLALEVPGKVKAVAAIAANLPVDENLDCGKSSQPVSVAIFNGTKDPVNPYAGGLVSIGGDASRGDVLSSSATAAYWAGLAGIQKPTEVISHTPAADDIPVQEQRWQGAKGTQVRLYTLEGAGHVIPSPNARFPRILGPEARSLSAANEIINFFMDETSS